jgi:hypothetical protein
VLNHVETNHWFDGCYSGVEEDWNIGCPHESCNWYIFWELDKQHVLSTQEQYNAGMQSAMVYVDIHQQLDHEVQDDDTTYHAMEVVVKGAESKELDEKMTGVIPLTFPQIDQFGGNFETGDGCPVSATVEAPGHGEGVHDAQDSLQEGDGVRVSLQRDQAQSQQCCAQ